MVTTKKKPSKGYRFLHDALKRNPEATFADLAKRAKAKRLTVHAIQYGKVKLDLGLVKRKAKKDKRPTKRKPGRPQKASYRRPLENIVLVDVPGLSGTVADFVAKHEANEKKLRKMVELIGD